MYAELNLDLIQESASNPRRFFDAAKLAELTDSIREKGVIQPILVRPCGEHYEVVCGARRYQAAKAAQLTALPCTIRDLDDKQVLEIQVIENLQRADISPLEEGEAYATLRNTHGYDVAGLAAKVGKSEAYIYQRLKVTEAAAPVKAALEGDKIHLVHALAIARLPEQYQVKALSLAHDWSDRLAPIAEFRRKIEQEFFLHLKDAAFDKSDPDLYPDAGSCKMCPKRTGSNPSLFEDIERADTCTDSKCFNTKLDRHLKARRKELEAAGETFVQISSANSYSSGNAKKGLLPTNAYREATKEDPFESRTTALVTEGPERGKRKSVVLKPAAEEFLSGKPAKPAKNTYDKDRESRERKAEERTKLRKALFQQLVAAGLGKVDSWHINFLINSDFRMDDRLDPEELKLIADAFGIAMKHTDRVNDDFFSVELNPLTLIKRAVTVAAACNTTAHGWGSENDLTSDQIKLAEYYSIDLKALKKSLNAKAPKTAAAPAEEPAEVPAKKAAKQKPAAKKARAKKGSK